MSIVHSKNYIPPSTTFFQIALFLKVLKFAIMSLRYSAMTSSSSSMSWCLIPGRPTVTRRTNRCLRLLNFNFSFFFQSFVRMKRLTIFPCLEHLFGRQPNAFIRCLSFWHCVGPAIAVSLRPSPIHSSWQLCQIEQQVSAHSHGMAGSCSLTCIVAPKWLSLRFTGATASLNMACSTAVSVSTSTPGHPSSTCIVMVERHGGEVFGADGTVTIFSRVCSEIRYGENCSCPNSV